MREYDLQEMKREEMEEVNGGMSQVDTKGTTSFFDSLKNTFNNIIDFFRGN